MQKEIQWLLKEKYPSASLRASHKKQILKDIKRLNGDEPLDYVIGFTEFLGCKIDLSKKPLIPRPETEFWVGQAINNILTFLRMSEYYKKEGIKAMDMFAGSGCIGVAILKHIKNSKVDFADKDENCLKQIKINLKINKIKSNRYKIIKSDIFNRVRGKYDYIFANPPYIPDYTKNHSARLRAILRNRIQKSVLKFEPQKALFGGKAGLFYIIKFLKISRKHLNPGGGIFMEFDSVQKKPIEKLVKEYGYASYEFHRDQYGRWRWIMIK